MTVRRANTALLSKPDPCSSAVPVSTGDNPELALLSLEVIPVMRLLVALLLLHALLSMTAYRFTAPKPLATAPRRRVVASVLRGPSRTDQLHSAERP